MLANPLISIIVPNYNHEHFLEQRLDSIFDQSFQNFEVILLDDCSADGSRLILEKYRNHPKTSHVLFNDENSGSTFKQWFKGIELAKGIYIWIAESDDYCGLHFLESVKEEFHKNLDHPDVVFVGTQNVDETGTEILRKTRIERKYSALLSKNFTLTGLKFLPYFLPNYCVIRNVSSAVFKKSIVTERARKAATFKTIGDFYFWVNACLEGHTFSYVSKTLNFMRNHPNNVRNSNERSSYKRAEYKRVHKMVIKRRFWDFTLCKVLFQYYVKQRLQLK